MKLTMKHITEGEDEVIIRYREMNEEVEAIASVVHSSGKRISGYEGGRQLFLLPEQIYYFESVDGTTYAYLIVSILLVKVCSWRVSVTCVK